jgi:hypothetical protein
MRIEILAVPSVSDGAGNRYRTGQIVDIDEDLARAWVAAGHARSTSGKAAAKRTATRPAPRTAAPKPKEPDDGGPAPSGEAGSDGSE